VIAERAEAGTFDLLVMEFDHRQRQRTNGNQSDLSRHMPNPHLSLINALRPAPGDHSKYKIRSSAHRRA
jgi:hypothetical protein